MNLDLMCHVMLSMATTVPVESTVEQLRARVAELELRLQKTESKREKIDQMSAEVVDSNPYRYILGIQIELSVSAVYSTSSVMQSIDGPAENGCGGTV